MSKKYFLQTAKIQNFSRKIEKPEHLQSTLDVLYKATGYGE